MLVWLVDQAYADNNTITHEGEGYALPVDVRPDSLTYPDGTSPSNRREPFDDSDPNRYWTPANPWNSVKVAGVGVTATVTAENADRSIDVQVSNP
ncbi:immune inhibitor A [Pimelobacter simplex]|nr:immune inhibitor A [Pimelobacter simplex]